MSEVDVNAGSIKYKLNVHGVLSIAQTYSYCESIDSTSGEQVIRDPMMTNYR